MKKLIVITVLSVLIGFSCNRLSKEETAQIVIKEMLRGTMFHPDSYESVSFGTLDSLYSCVEEDSLYIILESRLTNLETQKVKAEKDLVNNKKSMDNLNQLRAFATVNTPYLDKKRREINERLNMYNSQIDSLQQRVDSIMVNFNSIFIGYTMEHRFKYLARGGFKMENTTLFYLDPDVTMVTKFKDDLGLVLEYNPATNKYEPK